LWESARVIRPFSTKVISTEPPPRSTMSALFRFRGIFFPTARAIRPRLLVAVDHLDPDAVCALEAG